MVESQVENLLLLYNERLEMLETGRSDSGHNLRALEPPLPLGDASGEQAAARLALPNDSDGGTRRGLGASATVSLLHVSFFGLP